MFFEADLTPTTYPAEVAFMGDTVPPNLEENWNQVGTVIAERVHFPEMDWSYSTEMTREIDPQIEGFWMWGDVLVHVIQATILESELYIYKRKEAPDEP